MLRKNSTLDPNVEAEGEMGVAPIGKAEAGHHVEGALQNELQQLGLTLWAVNRRHFEGTACHHIWTR